MKFIKLNEFYFWGREKDKSDLQQIAEVLIIVGLLILAIKLS